MTKLLVPGTPEPGTNHIFRMFATTQRFCLLTRLPNLYIRTCGAQQVSSHLQNHAFRQTVCCLPGTQYCSSNWTDITRSISSFLQPTSNSNTNNQLTNEYFKKCEVQNLCFQSHASSVIQTSLVHTGKGSHGKAEKTDDVVNMALNENGDENDRIQRVQSGSNGAPKKKKKKPKSKVVDKVVYEVLGFATAEEYNMDSLTLELERELYQVNEITDVEDAVHAHDAFPRSQYPRPEMLIYKQGCIVFWNFPKEKREYVLQIAAKHGNNPLPPHEIEDEDLPWEISNRDTPDFISHVIHIPKSMMAQPDEDGNVTIDPRAEERRAALYTFSDAMMRIMKLHVLKEEMRKYSETVEDIPEKWKCQEKSKNFNKEFVSESYGYLFSFRHKLNLDEDLILSDQEESDFYWERDELNALFKKVHRYYGTNNQMKRMNDQLTYHQELLQSMDSMLQHEHSSKLETTIIWLIAVEIFIAVIHMVYEDYIKSRIIRGKSYFT